MPTRKERRIFKVAELRVAGDGADRRMSGHAAVFNLDSEEMYGFTERVAPGAFTRTLREDDIRALFNHDPNYVLGRNVASTLRLSEDPTGLAFEVDPPDTQWARDLAVSIGRGDITQCSFGFMTRKDEWQTIGGRTIRTLMDVQLLDVSPVTYPAYPDTDVSLRSLEEIAEEGRKRLAPGGTTVSSVAQLRRRLDFVERT